MRIQVGKLTAAAIIAMSVGSVSAQANDTQEKCIERWIMAENAGIIIGVDDVRGVTTVIVDERTFLDSPFDVKMGMVDTLNCAALGPGRFFREIAFVSDRSKKRLARWRIGRGLVVD